VVHLADNICGQDRRQFALLTGHGNFPGFVQRIVEGGQLTSNLDRVLSACVARVRPVGEGISWTAARDPIVADAYRGSKGYCN